MKPFSPESRFGKWVMSIIQGYDHAGYWRMRAVVVDPDDKTPLLLKLWYLYKIKRMDARHGCSFGTNLHAGAAFAMPPRLPHGPVGIFVGHDVRVGANVTIFQQVTIAHGAGWLATMSPSELGARCSRAATSEVVRKLARTVSWLKTSPPMPPWSCRNLGS